MELISERVVTLDVADLERRVPLVRPARPPTRAVGAHQSTVLQYIALRIGKLKPGERTEDEYPLLWGLGVAWEEWVLSFYPDLVWQPGEIAVDGIAMNCDGLGMLDGEPVVEEAKFTFKRARSGAEFLADEWQWLHQGRAYCAGYGPRLVRWHVCFVRGNYQAFGPLYKQYVVRFMDSEAEQTMEMLRTNKDAAMRELEGAA